MRRVEIQVKNKEQIKAIIHNCNTIRLGVVSEGAPYILPMVFGYSWTEEYPVFYLHCGMAGRKNDALYEGARVCFELDLEGQLTGKTPYANGYSREFCCIMGEGIIHFARNAEEKIMYFDYLMEHQTGRKGFTYQPGWLTLTQVFELKADKLSAAQKGMSHIMP